MIVAASYNKKQLLLIGNMLVATQPEVAASLFSKVDVKPVETDLSKLPYLLSQFKEHLQTNALMTDQKRLFISVILRLYVPHLYHMPDTHQYIEGNGLFTQTGRILGITQSNMSTYIRQVIFWEKTNFEGFGDKVQQAIKEIGGEGG